MKNKIIVLLSAFLFCMTLGIKDVMAAAASDVNCTNPCINSYEIQDGQVATNDIANNAVTNAKIADGAVANTKILDGAVTTSKIPDGAVTDAKISGVISGTKLGAHTHNGSDIVDSTITTSKVADGAVTDAKITGPISSSKMQKPANVIVVAKSGGDFTTIQSAIDSITPSATNTYLIKVMPGTYTENITMKSYIHLQGAGRDVTTIQNIQQGIAIDISNLLNVTVSGFTISTNGSDGVYIYISSSITITDNTITGCNFGVGSTQTSSVIIKGNIISGNLIGVYDNSSTSTITGNIITGNRNEGILVSYSSPVVTGNTITGTGRFGIQISGASSATITYNKTTDNGTLGFGDTDIYVYSGMPNISFNVYDTIMGDTGVGQFNVNSNGDPAPAP